MAERPEVRPAPNRPVGPSIAIRRVSKQFAHKNGIVQALSDVELDIPPGEFVSFIGPSGCGKSTLLRIIGALMQPESGEVVIGSSTPQAARAAKCFGLVPQTPALLPWRTVLENVTLLEDVGKSALRRRGKDAPSADGSRDPLALLNEVGLADFVGALPKQLSGGMQQRVSLVRAFVLGAPILLMDEPFAALDAITRNAMRYQLLDIWGHTRTTVVFVTHSIDEAVMLSDRVVTMASRPGRVAAIEEITLPRPRTEDAEESPQFIHHAKQIKAALRGGWKG